MKVYIAQLRTGGLWGRAPAVLILSWDRHPDLVTFARTTIRTRTWWGDKQPFRDRFSFITDGPAEV